MPLGHIQFSLSGQTLFYTGGTMTLNGVTNGTFTATTAATGGVQLARRSFATPITTLTAMVAVTYCGAVIAAA